MRPGGLRRTSWGALAALLGGTATALVVTAPAAQASVTVSEVYGRPSSGVFHLLGHGWGHGHGLSQYGAQGAATIGKTADEITATYYPNTARAVQGNPTMRILLSVDTRTNRREFVPLSGQVMKDLKTAATIAVPTTATRWIVTSDSAGLHVSYISSGVTHAVSGTYQGPIQVSGGSVVRVRTSSGFGKDYRTSVRVLRYSTASLRSIAVMPMEYYLYGVVPRESSSSWAAAALQAQAIAARSYSEYKRDHVASTATYDICDTTQCQVFGGTASYTNANDTSTKSNLEASSTTNAVNATKGVIRTYGGKAVFAEFSASNGGWSTDGGTPYLVAKADPWDGITGSTSHSWKAALPVTSLECRYGPKNSDGSCATRSDGTPAWRLTRVTITQRDGNGEWGGRVEAATIDFVDSSGTAQHADASGSGFYYARTWPTYSDGLRSRWFHIIPEYDASLVSRSSVPTLVHAPGNPKASLYAVLKNTGNASWPVSGLHLAVASPPGSADPLVGGSTRPGSYVKNLTTPGATTVAPGEQAQFLVPVDATKVAAGTRTASYRLQIGTASLFGATVSWLVTIQDPQFTGVSGAPPQLVSSSYSQPSGGPAALMADGRTVIVPRNGTTTVRLSTKNTGNLAWPVDGHSPVQLGTSAPRNRTSASWSSAWLSSNQVSRLVAPAPVGPGGTGTFDLPLAGNGGSAGVTNESFEPEWSGQSWISGDPTTLTVVRVDPTVSRLASIDTALRSGFSLIGAPTGRADLVLRLRNLGSQPWTVGQEGLRATATPLAYQWLSATKPSALARNVTRPGQTRVFPGEVGEWVVKVSGVKAAPGSYSFTVRPETPSGAVYGPSSTVTAKVLAATFTGQLVRTRSSVDVPSHGTNRTFFDVKNTGNAVWPVGGALRSWIPAGTSPAHDPSWLSASRPAALSENVSHPGATSVRPGEIARFWVVLAGNGRVPQTTSQTLGMIWDGWRTNPFRVTVTYRIT